MSEKKYYLRATQFISVTDLPTKLFRLFFGTERHWANKRYLLPAQKLSNLFDTNGQKLEFEKGALTDPCQLFLIKT